MSDLVFNGRFIPQSSVQISVDEFDVQADFFDGLGIFSAFDIKVEDIVFLDCFASITAPGTVNRYKVIQLNSVFPLSINCRLKWDDTGTIIDPSEIAGSAGFICRPSDNKGFPVHAAPTIHTIPDYVIQYSRNNDLRNILDPFLNKYVKNTTGSTIGQYNVVAWKDDGTIGLADAATHSLSDVAGITTKAILNGEWGWIVKTGYVPNALSALGCVPGDPIYLSGTIPGQMTKNYPIGSPDTITVLRLGRAEPPSGVVSAVANDLHMEMEIIAEP